MQNSRTESQKDIRYCRSLMVTAPASGQGKTTVTAALAQLFRLRGMRVRVFKTGPDFLDPQILACASGAPVYPLDLWMGGESHCRELLYQAAAECDVILIEGVMGLFDGEPSGADLAETFGLPVLAVIDASAMAQTFGAVAFGLQRFRPSLNFVGVLANRVGSPAHAALVRDSLPSDLPWCGALLSDSAITIPSRHLGLNQAGDIVDLPERIQHAAILLEDVLGSDLGDWLPPVVAYSEPVQACPMMSRIKAERPLQGVKIAIAHDAAFSFIYPSNLDVLQLAGADLCFFSPLQDSLLPNVDSLYLPGGYPELHSQKLASNTAILEAIRAHHHADKPIVAECGGMLYLLESLIDQEGQSAAMVGVLPGQGIMQDRLQNIGMHQALLPEGQVRGHSFHYSRMESPLTATSYTMGARGQPEAVYRKGRLHASYLHLYFPSHPDACIELFKPTARGSEMKSAGSQYSKTKNPGKTNETACPTLEKTHNG